MEYEQRSNGVAVGALVAGILSIVSCIPFISVPSGIVAMAMGSRGRRRARLGADGGGMATAGLVLGAIPVVLWSAILGGCAMGLVRSDIGVGGPLGFIQNLIQTVSLAVDETTGNHVPLTVLTSTSPLSDDVKKLTVRGRVGAVTIRATDAPELTITADVRINSDRFDEVVPGEFADHVFVKQVDGEFIISDAHADAEDKRDWSVWFTIDAPPDLVLDAGVGIGDLDVEGMTGNMTLKAGAGDLLLVGDSVGSVSIDVGIGQARIRIDHAAGEFNVVVGTGDLDAVLSKPPKSAVHVEVGTGNVTLDLPDDCPGNYSLKAGIGNVEVHGFSEASNTSGFGPKAEFSVGEAGPKIEVTAGLGSVAIR